MHSRHKTKPERRICQQHGCGLPMVQGSALCRFHSQQMGLFSTKEPKTLMILGQPFATPHKLIDRKKRSLKLKRAKA
jgi:hypothetical protein